MFRVLVPAALMLGLSACDLLGLDGPDGPPPVPVCAGQVADTSGHRAAGDALQACIAATPAGAVLELPPGVYRIDRQLVLDHPMTLRPAGSAGRTELCWPVVSGCVVLRADRALFLRPGTGGAGAHNGIMDVAGTRDVRLEFVVLDGNRKARLSSAAASRCSNADNRYGFNAAVRGSTLVQFVNSASVNALCGTGLEWSGDSAVVENSLFQDNGDHKSNGLWADGLTVLLSNGARIVGNRFVDNSDIDLILGGAKDAVVRDNVIVQQRQASFGGLMLNSFGNGIVPDFSGAVVEENSIDCGSGKCNFGIALGGHPWAPWVDAVRGGEVRNNRVEGAYIAVNADGAGTAAQPVQVYGNTLKAMAPVSVQCRVGTDRLTTSLMNVGPDAVVDRHGDPTPATQVTWHLCADFRVLGAAQ